SQFASIESFLPNAVRVNMKEAVIMLGESANNNDEKRFMIPGFTEKVDRHYAAGEGIAMVSTAGKKWTSPHFFETPLFVD
ncbi:cell division protein FtsK, partial [Leuconostoc mesenteroides]|nr:cell division protein FtsK [Leuconostoc mesenteroides]